MGLTRADWAAVASFLALTLQLVGAGCSAEQEDPPADATPVAAPNQPPARTSKSPPLPGSMEEFKALAQSSATLEHRNQPTWEVYRKGDRTFVRHHEFYRDKLKHVGDQIKSGWRWRVSDGYLHGTNQGEFGGGLEWVPSDRHGQRYWLTGQNVHGFVELKGQLYVLTGLAHLSIDEGEVMKLVRNAKTGRWAVEKFVDLHSAPEVFVIDSRGALIVATASGLVEVWPDKAPRVLVPPDRWGGMYPNSIVLASPDTLYIGMRRAVAEVSSLRTTPTLRFHIRDDLPPAMESSPKTGKFDMVLALDAERRVTMGLAKIGAGKFTMGSPESEVSRKKNEGPQRQVTITRAFHMGVTEVTQAQWRAVMATEPWQAKPGVAVDDNTPACHVSWDDATAFCTALSKKTGKSVRLPTEAEWEYACRADARTRFHFDAVDGGALDDYAWYEDNASPWNESYNCAHPVGMKKPNAWGLYDMHGNMWEWCSDPYAGSSVSLADTNPQGSPVSGPEVLRDARVIRGGAWNSPALDCRSAKRKANSARTRDRAIGFRVVVEGD